MAVGSARDRGNAGQDIAEASRHGLTFLEPTGPPPAGIHQDRVTPIHQAGLEASGRARVIPDWSGRGPHCHRCPCSRRGRHYVWAGVARGKSPTCFSPDGRCHGVAPCLTSSCVSTAQNDEPDAGAGTVVAAPASIRREVRPLLVTDCSLHRLPLDERYPPFGAAAWYPRPAAIGVRERMICAWLTRFPALGRAGERARSPGYAGARSCLMPMSVLAIGGLRSFLPERVTPDCACLLVVRLAGSGLCRRGRSRAACAASWAGSGWPGSGRPGSCRVRRCRAGSGA